MDLDLRTLSIFVKVAEHGSFVRAAQALDVSQAGVSNAIKRLEIQLGTTLLARTTRRVNLTEDGEAFFHRCRQVLADLEDARQALAGSRREPAGTLRISLPTSFGRLQIVPRLAGFQVRHPKVALAVSLTDRFVDLVDEGIDVAVRLGTLEDSSLIARPLTQTRRQVLASPAYLARHGIPATPATLATHNCLALTYHETGRPRRWSLQDAGEPLTVMPKGSMTFNDGPALHAAVLAGLGLGQLHDYIVRDDVAAGRLTPVLTAFAARPDPVTLLYPRSRHLSAKVRAFVDYLVEPE